MTLPPRKPGPGKTLSKACHAFLVLSSLAVTAHSESKDSYMALLERAAEGIDLDYRNEWSFTETLTTSKGTFIGVYDPRLREGGRWKLRSVDGRTPKTKEIKNYLKEKAEEKERSDAEPPQRPEDMVKENSLMLIEETDKHWLLGFVPTAEGENGEFMEYLKGRLKIVKDGPRLEFMEMRSSGPFKPRFTVKVRSFFMHFEYGPAADEGPQVLQALEFNIDIKAIGILKIRESGSLRISDYKYVGD